MIAIKVPPLGESIVEATVSRWLKQEGDLVAAGDTLVELETDKITVEVPALKAGVLTSRTRAEGDVVAVDDLLGQLDESWHGRCRRAQESVNRDSLILRRAIPQNPRPGGPPPVPFGAVARDLGNRRSTAGRPAEPAVSVRRLTPFAARRAARRPHPLHGGRQMKPVLIWRQSPAAVAAAL